MSRELAGENPGEKQRDARQNDAKQRELRELSRSRRKALLLSILSILTLLLVWQLAVRYKLVNTRFLESPIDVFKTIFNKFTVKRPDGGLLYQHIIESANVVWMGFFFGAVIGIPLGLFMGWYRNFDRIIRPLFEVVRPIPSLAWIPIVLVFFGIGAQARAAIIFFGSFVGIVLNTYTGIRQTNQTHINVSKTCGNSEFRTFYKVGIPSAMPMIFAGLKISMGAAWGTVVAAEMLAAAKGLGYMIQIGRTYGEVSLIMAGILVIGVCGLLSSWLISLLESAVLRWRPKKHG